MEMLLLEIQMDQSQCGEKVQDSRILLLQYLLVKPGQSYLSRFWH